jgi:predicted DNA-binding transcriptional regulator YafY
MSREFEVSVRTLKRDIEFMKDTLNMPIAFDVPKNGYYFTTPQPHFPSLAPTEKEIGRLFLVQKNLMQYQRTSLQPVLEAAFRKMTGQLDDSVRYSLGNVDEMMSIRPYAPGDAELETFELLMRAIREKMTVRFTYRKYGELTTHERKAHPYHVAYVNNQWTLFPFEPSPLAMRKFVLVRLGRPELTHEKFAVLKKFNLDQELRGSLGVFKCEHDYESGFGI